MLIIEEGDEVVLSQEFHAAHNVAVHFHDQMASVIMEEGYEKFRDVSYDVPGDAPGIEEVGEGRMGVEEYMATYGLRAELTELLVSDIVQALLTDFLHFIHESLSCAKRGKISVAYALLRKPFEDLLLLFEQILADKQDFIERFHHQGDTVGYDPSFASLDKKAIVAAATAKLTLRDFFTDDLVWQIRYDKTAHAGIASYTHRAHHIVTRNKHYPTRPRDFNFVFDSVESLQDYWKNYYTIVPYVLMYAASVVDAIVFDFMPAQERAKQVKDIRRFALYIFMKEAENAGKMVEVGEEMLGIVLNALTHTCKSCGHEIHFTKPDLVLFSKLTVMLCDKCFTDQFTDDDFYLQFLVAWHALVPLPTPN